jgi:hypothetical protein
VQPGEVFCLLGANAHDLFGAKESGTRVGSTCTIEYGVRSAKCEVRSAECGVRSAECEVRSAGCGVRSD